ncbi:MAG: 50S ribosomal protein L10 [Rikenellaceae bacterium]
MKREEKTIIINALAEKLQQYPHYYVTDIADLNAKQTAELRKACFNSGISLVMVKNTLLREALKSVNKADDQIFAALKGSSSVMFCEVGNAPAKLIKDFGKKNGKPELKAAYVDECVYIGSENLETLVNIKSHDEMIAEVIALLQSPAKNVISALQSSGHKLSGIVKTLSEKAE